MWPYLIELVKFLPPDPCQHILNFVLNIEFSANELILLTGLILSAWQNPRLNAKDVLTSLILKFEQLSSNAESRSAVDLNLSSLLYLTTMLHSFMRPGNREAGPVQFSLDNSSPYQDILFCDLPDKEAIEEFNNETNEVDGQLVDLLMELYKAAMNQISFDVWLSGAEISSEKVLNNAAGVEFWPAESAAPSNMQMLIAHHQAVCCDIIKVNKLLEFYDSFHDFFSECLGWSHGDGH